MAEEHACFRPRWSTVEQIFNSRVIIENLTPTTPALSVLQLHGLHEGVDRVKHAGLWQVLRNFNVEDGLVQAVQALYEISSSAVLLNSQLGEFFKTKVGIRQGCLLSPVLSNLFLEKIMQKTLHDHHTSISIGGRPICNLQFSDDIDFWGGSSGELQDFTNRIVDRATAY